MLLCAINVLYTGNFGQGNEKLKLVSPYHGNDHATDYGRSKIYRPTSIYSLSLLSIYRPISIYRNNISIYRPIQKDSQTPDLILELKRKKIFFFVRRPSETIYETENVRNRLFRHSRCGLKQSDPKKSV